MSKNSCFDLYNGIKNLLIESGNNLNNFCNEIIKLSSNNSKRLILNTMFNSTYIPFKDTHIDKNMIINSLSKIPIAIYLPINPDKDTKSNLSELLQDSLEEFKNLESNKDKLKCLLSNLKNTTEFMVVNGLHYNYGPMRPFLLEFLKQVEKQIVETEILPNDEKLYVLINLYDLMKANSMDPTLTFTKIKYILVETPNLMNNLSSDSLSILKKSLAIEYNEYNLEKLLKSKLFVDLNTLIDYSDLVFNTINNKVLIETYLYGLYHKMIRENCKTTYLFNLLKNLKTLSLRHNDKDIIQLTNQLLEIMFSKFFKKYFFNKGNIKELNKINDLDIDDFILIFETYINLCGHSNNILYKSFHETLFNYVMNNKKLFNPFQLIEIITNLNENLTNFLIKGVYSAKHLIRNKYLGREDVIRELIEFMVDEFTELESENLCGLVNSLSITQFMDLYCILCRYLYNGEGWELNDNRKKTINKVLELVKKRIIDNVDHITSNRNLYMVHMSKIMAYEDDEINTIFSNNVPKLAMKILLDQKIELLLSNKNNTKVNNNFMTKLLNNMYSKAEHINHDEVFTALISNNIVRKDGNMTNKLFSILNYNNIKNIHGYKKLLRSTQYLPCENTFLLNSILNHLNLYMYSLNISDAYYLLNTLSRFNILNNSNLKNLLLFLNYIYDEDLQNPHNTLLLNILSYLKTLRVRHEPLIKKFTDRLMTNFKSSVDFIASDLISLNYSLSGLSVSHNDLNLFLLNYLDINAGVLEKGGKYSSSSSKEFSNYSFMNFKDLDLSEKINLLHSITNFGIVDKNLKTLFLSVIKQVFDTESSEQCLKNDEEGEDSSYEHQESTLNKKRFSESEETSRRPNEGISNKWLVKEKGVDEKKVVTQTLKDTDQDLFMKLYEIHIDLVVNGLYTNEMDSVGKKLESTSKSWFMNQELKSHNFRRSNTYIDIKGVLDRLGMKFESGVTEVYFCNFVLRDRPRPTVLYVVPEEDVLRLWTTSLDPRNVILEPISIGNSQKIIKNLNLSGYQVVELFQSKWDSLDFEKEDYLQTLLN